MEEVSGYIFEGHLAKFVEHVAWCAGYRWDGLDDGALDAGLNTVDEDADVWFGYPVGELTLHLTQDPGGSMIRVRITGLTNEVAAVHLDTFLARTGRAEAGWTHGDSSHHRHRPRRR